MATGMARTPILAILGGVLTLLLYAAAAPDARPDDKSPSGGIFSFGRQAKENQPTADPHDTPFQTWFPTEKPNSADETSGDSLGDPPAILPPIPVDSEHTIKQGDTLRAVLARAGIAAGEAEQAIRALKKVYDPRRLQPGHEIYLEMLPPDRNGRNLNLLSMDFRATATLDISVVRETEGGFSAKTHKRAVGVRDIVRPSDIELGSPRDLPRPSLGEGKRQLVLRRRV